MINLQSVYILAGLMFCAFALFNLRDKSNARRYVNALFWGVYGVTFLSGGEHRTPVYLIFGAALAAAYGRSKGSRGGGGIMLLDEAFEKMDPQNIRAAVQFLNSLGLQLIMAGPESDQGKLSSFLSMYYDMARFGTRNIQMKKNTVLNRAQELLQSDNYLLNPDILTQELARLAEEQSNAG